MKLTTTLTLSLLALPTLPAHAKSVSVKAPQNAYCYLHSYSKGITMNLDGLCGIGKPLTAQAGTTARAQERTIATRSFNGGMPSASSSPERLCRSPYFSNARGRMC